MNSPVVSTDAEGTIRLLMLTVAQHARQEAVLVMAQQPRGRLRTLPTSSVSHQTRTQSTLLRITSIIEAHVVRQLVQHVEPHIPAQRTAVLDDIYARAEDNAIGSWPGMIDAYKRWLGIRLTSYSDWKSIQAMIDARNAIVHGLGELTRRQARKDLKQLTKLLSAINVQVKGTRVEVSEESLRCAAVEGRSFVIWLDVQLSALST